MDQAELSRSLQDFLLRCVPTFPSAEFLLFLAQHADRAWLPEQVVEAMKPAVITASAVQECLAVYRSCRLVEGDFHAGFRFAPSTPQLRAAVDELAQAFNERPVTLIRTIYALSENKIRSFADSFKLT